MKLHKTLFKVLSIGLLFASPSVIVAADFDWSIDLNMRSQSDPVRYRSQLGTRFGMDDGRIHDLYRHVEQPADVYLILRLAEMSSRSPEYVLERYKSNKHRGWGEVAHSLGIKPGSDDFRALKSGHDMHDNDRDRNDRNDRNDNRRNDGDHNKGKGRDKN